MEQYVYSAEVHYLLSEQTNEKVNVKYNENAKAFKLPKIGKRPPYFAHPRYEPSYPKI